MVYQLPKLPDSITDPAVKDILEKYYEHSNKHDDHKPFANLFTKDGEYAMNGRSSEGPEEILKFRKAIFSHVPKRDHHPHDIFTHGTDQKNLMVFGGVKYDHHLGHSTETEWAARYTLAEEDGQLKFKKVHIVVDTAAHV